MVSTKTVRNDVYLTAIINTQEQEIQKLKAINNELHNKLSNDNVSIYLDIFFTLSIVFNFNLITDEITNNNVCF